MNDIVIKAENLGKKYVIGHQAENGRYVALRDVLMQSARSFWSKTKDLVQGKPIIQGDTLEEVWALKDANFDIHRGEAVGIIGRNGAGKSTLLKVLSRITEPSAGRVTIKGRVASLLEVGTGFHPELTGRENIYLNGAILGMTRAEIKQKFDKIVAFAEVEQYLDTPVKRYSSGMYVRLAFAVAAHLEPEILVVDEVLAVGDAQFQKKCLGKMEEVGREGRTVLFVSHNMAAISALCKKAITLKNGQMMTSVMEVNKAIDSYLSSLEAQTEDLSARKDRQGEGKIRIIGFGIFDRQGKKLNTLISGQYAEFRIYYSCINNPKPANVSAGISISSTAGQFLVQLGNEMAQGTFDSINQEGYIVCKIVKLPIAPMKLKANLIIRQNNIIQDWIQEAVTIIVESGDFYGTGQVTEASHGGFLMEQEWHVK